MERQAELDAEIKNSNVQSTNSVFFLLVSQARSEKTLNDGKKKKKSCFNWKKNKRRVLAFIVCGAVFTLAFLSLLDQIREADGFTNEKLHNVPLK